MSAVDRFLHELESALHLRGRTRRRLVAECRDHLADSSAAHGPEEAVRRFGPAAELARAFETEVAVRRARRTTAVTLAGVLGVGLSTLAMIHGADPHGTAPVAWAVVFFGGAQVSAAALGLAVLRAVAMRDEAGTPADVALLCRRNALALGFAFLTMFAVGAGVPGQTTAWQLLAGPVVALGAAVCVARARTLARRIDRGATRVVRPPLDDAAVLVGRLVDLPGATWTGRPGVVLLPTVVVAAAAAFSWDLLDHGTWAASGLAAGVEAAMTVAGFVVLGRSLGLHAAPARRP